MTINVSPLKTNTTPSPVSVQTNNNPKSTSSSLTNVDQFTPGTFPTLPKPYGGSINTTPVPSGTVANPLTGGPSTLNTYGAATTQAPVVPPAPTKPTAVVSSKPAATQANAIKTTADTAQQNIVNTNAVNAANTAAATTTPPPPPPPTTGTSSTTSAEDTIANAPDDGMQTAYNINTGQREDQPIGPLQPGYTSTDPLTRAATNTVDTPGGIQYKQFSDGTYGRFNVSTGAYSPASASDFADAQAISTATTNLNNIKNGVLTPSQQSQIDAVTSAYQNLITQTGNQFNQNTSGALSILASGTGVGIGPSVISNITKLANDAATTIASAQVDLAKQVASMQEAFLQDDTDALKDSYTNYNNDQSTIQSNIDNVQNEIDKQNDKITASNASIAEAMAKKYTDTSTPILPTDTAEQVKAKLATSPKWQQDQTVAASLDKDETQFWADMALSGAGQDVAIPNIGIGAAAAATKVQILKSIADNAKALGMTAQDVANSLLDKNSKAKAYASLQQNGTKLATQEQGVEQNFDLVKQLGAKVPASVIQTGIPLLQGWINTGVLASSNNAALNNWLGALTTTLTKYAGVVSGNTGSGGVSQAANSEAQALIKQGLNPDTVNSYIDNTAVPEMKNTISSYSKSLSQIQDDLNMADGTINTNTLGVGNAGTTSSSGGSGGFAEAW